MFEVTLKVDLKTIDDFNLFIKDVRKDIIENGLDETLDKSVEELRDSLKFTINEKIRGSTDPDKTKITEDLGDYKLDMPKSDQEILKFLTGIDVDQIRKRKDFTSAVESNVAFIQDNRVRYRLNMDANENFDIQYKKAIDFYNKAIFVNVDSRGNLQYYVNPGIDLSTHVKVVCSRETGDTSKSRKRFDTHKNRRGFADWALKQDAVKDLVLKNFINISDVVDKIKDGNYSDAEAILQRAKSNKNTSDLTQKISDLKTKKNLTPGIEAHNNIMSLVNNLKILKKISKEKVTYTLISNFDDSNPNNKDFFEEMRKAITLWSISNHNFWFATLVEQTEKIIQEYEKG
jgi:hypothetical protein